MLALVLVLVLVLVPVLELVLVLVLVHKGGSLSEQRNKSEIELSWTVKTIGCPPRATDCPKLRPASTFVDAFKPLFNVL